MTFNTSRMLKIMFSKLIGTSAQYGTVQTRKININMSSLTQRNQTIIVT